MADQVSGLLSGYLRRRRLEAAQPYLTGRVLDFGCGVGLLAPQCDAAGYLGVDIDAESIAAARAAYPEYRFATELPADGAGFDVVIMLALIEHVPDPAGLLRTLAAQLAPDGRIVMTTPHRRASWMHDVGAKVGLFSREASDEHEVLFDHALMKATAGRAGLRVVKYRRFLFGVNQLFEVMP